jgi:hypothetical protein
VIIRAKVAVLGMGAVRRSAGLQRKLLERSIEAYVLALETINRLSITYRVETFTYLVCNAWELLLKARILADSGDKTSIYYAQEPSKEARTLSLRDCMKRVFKDGDPVRLNIERVEELRDDATHLVISQIPKDILGLFQACVLNYHKLANEWFGISLSKRVPVGMMTIVYDFGPDEVDLSNRTLRRRLGRATADYLTKFQARLRDEYVRLGRPNEFAIDINYRLAFTKREDDADIIIASSKDGVPSRIVEVPKDPCRTHPFRKKDLIARVNAALGPDLAINTYDVHCVEKVHGVRKRSEFFYQGSVRGSPIQFSQAFADWLVEQTRADGEFFTKARESYRAMESESSPVISVANRLEHQADVQDVDAEHPPSDAVFIRGATADEVGT